MLLQLTTKYHDSGVLFGAMIIILCVVFVTLIYNRRKEEIELEKALAIFISLDDFDNIWKSPESGYELTVKIFYALRAAINSIDYDFKLLSPRKGDDRYILFNAYECEIIEQPGGEGRAIIKGHVNRCGRE